MARNDELKGLGAMQRKLESLAKRFPDEVKRALFIIGEEVMTDSKKNFVPVDDGALRSSGKVHPPRRSGKNVSVVLSYGDTSAPYALAIHEHPSDASPPSWKNTTVTFSPGGRGPKYLQKPLMMKVRSGAKDLAKLLNIEDMV